MVAAKRSTSSSRTSRAIDDEAYTVEEGREPTADGDLAASLPPSMSIDVELPAPVRETPEEEQAVALDDHEIDPAVVQVLTSGVTTISLSEDALAAMTPAEPITGALDLPTATTTRRDRLDGTSEGPETAAMLTADRLLDHPRGRRPAPEGFWPRLAYTLSFHLLNLGDSARVRARKELDARIATPFVGGARFVPVLTRKGGVGKTTVTTLLGMALADVRDDRVVAIDANPDRGTLSERVARQTRATVRDVVNRAPSISGFTDFSTFVSRDETRLDILASDTDPMLSEAFDENDYNVVADLSARFYSIVLTDCGTGIVHSVMRATLRRADSIVIVSGGSVDEARLASETLTWLEANGYGELVRSAVVAINTGTQGTNLVKLEEIEAHFASRVRAIVRMPYDEHLASGSVITWASLRPLTRSAARELAALVAEGMPERRGV
ncbi:MAG: MinD/ParA family protein [Microcella sp.]|uniref:MinD/ParA family ATP-binding protein n=1 Tax=Microcella sp. TaxID=1913979 RepID=UPI003314ACE6